MSVVRDVAGPDCLPTMTQRSPGMLVVDYTLSADAPWNFLSALLLVPGRLQPNNFAANLDKICTVRAMLGCLRYPSANVQHRR
jgi:hypothetical protein